ncbi:MAG: hypothetical protein ABGW77_05270 [Campylobacterales bacterium]
MKIVTPSPIGIFQIGSGGLTRGKVCEKWKQTQKRIELQSDKRCPICKIPKSVDPN